MPPQPEAQPKIRWKRLLLKSSVWLSAELVLNVVGLDNIADYSEFLLKSQVIAQVSEVVSNLITMV
jgi:hypothetical protein